jgi:hypothetical protein
LGNEVGGGEWEERWEDERIEENGRPKGVSCVWGGLIFIVVFLRILHVHPH